MVTRVSRYEEDAIAINIVLLAIEDVKVLEWKAWPWKVVE